MRFKVLLPILIGFIFVGCSEQKVEEVQRPKVNVVKILDLKDVKGHVKSYEYPALIYSLQDTSMAFEVSGKITKFYYKEGELVKKGSVIAKLDDTIYKANYNLALANYKQAQLDYKRYKKLYESRTIAKRDFEKVKQSLDVNRSNYNIAKKKLGDTKLRAEFDGIMAKKLVKDFERITEKQSIIRLQDNSAYKVKFFAPESDILQVQEKINAQSASKAVDFYVTLGESDKRIPARFLDISTTAEEISRTFEVTLKIETQKNMNILPGMTAKVNVIGKDNKKQNMFIPVSAVFSDSTKESYVWIIDENRKVHKQKIETGRLQNDSIEIIKGLDKSSKIVTSGVRFLKENDLVKEYRKIGN